MTPAIVLDNVSRTYTVGPEVIRAVDGVSLDIDPGSFVAIMGASGSGKSTLLNLISGIDQPDQGVVTVAGVEVSGLNRARAARFRLDHLGVVFQDNNLIDEFSAFENVLLPLEASGWEKTRAHDEAMRTLRIVGVEALAERLPHDMSGGQRQRIGIARALAGGREVLVADEPTGNLDSANTNSLFEVFADLASNHGMTIVVATHETSIAQHAHVVHEMIDGRLTAAAQPVS